jgi:hypothetical protein
MRQTTESVAGFPPDVAMPVTGASKSPAAPSLGLRTSESAHRSVGKPQAV